MERKQEDFVRCGEIVYLQKTKRRWQISREQLSQRRNLGRIIYMYRRTDGKSNSATWRTALTSAQYLNYNVSLILWKKSLFHIIFNLVRRLCLGFKRRDNRHDLQCAEVFVQDNGIPRKAHDHVTLKQWSFSGHSRA